MYIGSHWIVYNRYIQSTKVLMCHVKTTLCKKGKVKLETPVSVVPVHVHVTKM